MVAFQPATPEVPRSHDGYRVAHALPGRVRLVLEGRQAGMPLAVRFAYHPDVTMVRWVEAARSLTVQHNPARSFCDLAEELPASHQLPAPITVITTAGPALATFLGFLFDLAGWNLPALGLPLVTAALWPKSRRTS